jgi:hypothetical protein
VVNRTNDGAPLAGKIRSAWEGILEDAGLGEDVVRHSLRHTAATWLMQQGTDRWQAAGWLGMTLEQPADGYGHHSGFQEEAAEAFGGRRWLKTRALMCSAPISALATPMPHAAATAAHGKAQRCAGDAAREATDAAMAALSRRVTDDAGTTSEKYRRPRGTELLRRS